MTSTGQAAYSTSMGYDLHITRRKDWSSSGNDIGTAEWLAYVARDLELSLWPENGPYMARWNGKCTYPDPWLDWFQGNVYTKNPDEALILKMVRIAKELNGQVQGDDGEIYRNKRDVKIYRNGSPRSVLDRLRNWSRKSDC
jgi:hypothetical protein